MEYIQILLGIVIGFLLAWLLIKVFNQKESNLIRENDSLKYECNVLQARENKNVDEYKKYQNQITQLKVQIAAIETENIHLRNAHNEKVKEIEKMQVRLTTEFENIANRVLKERSIEISDHNQKRMMDLLNPLKEKIGAFEKKVEETYDKGLRDHLSLKAEVKKLFDLNHRISEEAGNLTRALKGDVKKMGNWGEMILERILEQSGLTKGREYRREVLDTNAEGETIRPDVIIDLPENKHLIIDSKMSLIAYEQYVNATMEEEKQLALKKHQESLRKHIIGLHEKNYSSATNLNTPDFVLMFIPVESSFAVAVEADSDLFSYAWERKIVPVSPSTLLATLKTISSIWRQENQTRNAQEIARQSGALYDKLVGFLTDFEKIGKGIEQLQTSYMGAMGKIQNGKGNLISRAEKIRELGAKNNKELPGGFTK